MQLPLRSVASSHAPVTVERRRTADGRCPREYDRCPARDRLRRSPTRSVRRRQAWRQSQVSAGLSAGAAIATGGLSLLGEGALAATSSDDGNPCEIALGIVPKKKPVATKPAEEKSTLDKTTDTIIESAGAIGDKLKGLFGK